MICTLYKIGTEVLFYTTKKRDCPEIYGQLLSGEVTAVDTNGISLSAQDAASQWDRIITRDLGKSTAEKALCNIDLSNSIIAIIRAEMMELIDDMEYFSYLHGVVALMQVGMYETGVKALESMAPNGFLTAERLTRYTSMLRSADALGG